MSANRTLGIFVAAAVLFIAPVHAQAPLDGNDGIAVTPPAGAEGMPAFADHAALAHVADDLAALWQTRPDLFDAVDAVREQVMAYHRGGAFRPMNVARLLEGIGDDRLLPLMWALSSDDPIALGMGLKAWMAWRVGLVESVGRLRDPRSVPVLVSIIEGDAPQTAIRRAAVSALGRTGDAGGIAVAIAVAESSPERRAAVIEGLGQARRSVAADYLLSVAGSGDDPSLRRLAVRALGDWGNVEAWRTPALSPWAEEGEAGRRAIVEALVDLYPDADPVLRAEIGKTLQLVDVHGSAARADARAASADDGARAVAWRELETAMQRSPLGTRQGRRR